MSHKLKEARIEAGYTIEEISEHLNIRKQYLIDLEEENYASIPGQIYVDGYTKLYKEFLGIETPKNTSPPLVSLNRRKRRNSAPQNKSRLIITISTLCILMMTLAIYKSQHRSKKKANINQEITKAIFINDETRDFKFN